MLGQISEIFMVPVDRGFEKEITLNHRRRSDTPCDTIGVEGAAWMSGG